MANVTFTFKASSEETIRYNDGTKGILTWPLPPSDVERLYLSFQTTNLLDLVETFLVMCNEVEAYCNVDYNCLDYLEAVLTTGRRVTTDYQLSDDTNYLARQRRLLYTFDRCLCIFEAILLAVPALKDEHAVQLAISRICRCQYQDRNVVRVLSNVGIDVVAFSL
jgi:hypothetical protein